MVKLLRNIIPNDIFKPKIIPNDIFKPKDSNFMEYTPK